MMRAGFLALLCAGLATAPGYARAAQAWTIRDGGTLGFTASWEGTEFDGVFQKFAGDIVFDPEDLAGSRFDVDVDVTSADTKSSDRDEGLADPEWFDFKQYPHATFVASAFRALGDDRYEATGTLTIKGVSHDLALPFKWEKQDGTAHLTGETTLQRTDFKLGEGEWADGEVVGLDVQVRIDVMLDAKADAG